MPMALDTARQGSLLSSIVLCKDPAARGAELGRDASQEVFPEGARVDPAQETSADDSSQPIDVAEGESWIGHWLGSPLARETPLRCVLALEVLADEPGPHHLEGHGPAQQDRVVEGTLRHLARLHELAVELRALQAADHARDLEDSTAV